jgi:hypothetical protein
MSETELRQLADLLEKMICREKVELTDSERMAAIKLVSAADQLAETRKQR